MVNAEYEAECMRPREGVRSLLTPSSSSQSWLLKGDPMPTHPANLWRKTGPAVEQVRLTGPRAPAQLRWKLVISSVVTCFSRWPRLLEGFISAQFSPNKADLTVLSSAYLCTSPCWRLGARPEGENAKCGRSNFTLSMDASLRAFNQVIFRSSPIRWVLQA